MTAADKRQKHPAEVATLPGFIRGARYIWRGFEMLVKTPSLWILAALPFVINLLVFAFVFYAAAAWLQPWVLNYFEDSSGWWWQAVEWLVVVLVWIAVLGLAIFAFVPIASLIAAPFNDLLSEKVERIYCGQSVDDPFSLKLLNRSLLLGLKTTVRLTSRAVLLLICTLPLYLIPVIGPPLATAAQALITIRFLALEYTSYSMDRRFYTFRQREAFQQRFRPLTLGMGAMAFAIMLIPILNAMFIPISAIAGTLLFCDTELKPGSSPTVAKPPRD